MWVIPNTDKLEIHHIDYNRFHNNPENLKLLCRNCHINWHRQNPDIRNWRRLTKIEIKGNKVYVKDYELYTANELRELERLEAQAWALYTFFYMRIKNHHYNKT